MSRRAAIVALCCVLLAATPSLAQEESGAVVGTAEDQTGAVVPAAQVILINLATRKVHEAVTDQNGRFSFEKLAPGEYSIVARAEDLVSEDKTVTVGTEVLKVKVKLRVGLEEEVTVTAGTSDALAVSNSGEVVTFDESLLRQLPSDGDFLSLATVFVTPAALGTGGPSIIVDGVETDELDVPVWAVKSVEVDRNPYSATYRKPGRSRIEITTKQGSRRRFRANLALFERNSMFDARNAFAIDRPPLSRSLLEGGLSGPLPFGRAWFLANGSSLTHHGTAIVNARTLSGALIQNVPANHDRTNVFAQTGFRLARIHAMTASYALLDSAETAQGVGGFTMAEHGADSNRREQRLRLVDQAVMSSGFSNSLQATVKRESQSISGSADSPSIVVHGAFTGGPSASRRRDGSTTVEVEDSAVYARGAHTFRFGARGRPKWLHAVDRSNFAGTLRFASLAAFAAADPFVSQINRGRPEASFDDMEASAYAQDEMRLSSNLGALVGLRYDWQSRIRTRAALAPRAAVTFAPGDQKTIVRAGAGVFYDRLPDSARRRALLFGGDMIEQAMLLNPGSMILPDASTGASTASVTRLADDLRMPYAIDGSVSVQRTVSKKIWITASFNRIEGRRLFRTRDRNAPLPGSPVRPNPAFLNINQVESTAALAANALTTTMRGEYGRVAANVQYRISRTTNDASGPFVVPADSYNLAAEKGRAEFDRRHEVHATATVSLPRAFKIGLAVAAASGIPYDITTGFDDNGDGNANDRPLGVTRNTGNGPARAQVDIRVGHRIHVATPIPQRKPQRNMDINVDVFNVFNTVNLENFVGVQTSPFFGRANAALAARRIQLSFNYHF